MNRTAFNIVVMCGLEVISVRLLIVAKRQPREQYLDVARALSIITLIVIALDVFMVVAL